MTDVAVNSSKYTAVNNVMIEQVPSTYSKSNVKAVSFANGEANKLSMSERPWDLTRMLGREYVLQSGNWTFAIGPQAVIFQINVLPAILASGAQWATMISQFVYFRCGIRIRVKLNGTRRHLGAAWVGYVPPYNYYSPTFMTATGGSVAGDTQKYGGTLDASISSSVVVDVGWSRIENYILTRQSSTFSNFSDFGWLTMTSLTGLSGSTGATNSLKWVVTVELLNCDLHVPYPVHTLPIGTAPRASLMDENVDDEYVDLRAEINLPSFSSIKDIFSNVGQAASGMEDATDAVQSWSLDDLMKAGHKVLNGVTGAVSGIAGFFLDYPNEAAANQQFTRQTINPPCYGEFRMNIPRLDIVPHGSHLVQNELTGDADFEEDIGRIIRIPTLFTYFQWSSTYDTGTVLTQMDINPGISLSQSGGVQTPTYLSYFSNIFAYWSGGIRYHFKFVSNTFYGGEVMIANFYGPSWNQTVGSITFEMAKQVPHITYKLGSAQDLYITVDYHAETPYIKTVPNFTTTIAPGPNIRCSLGVLVMFVLNPLTTNDGSPAEITILGFVSAADDFEFAVLRPPYMQVIQQTIPSLEEQGFVEYHDLRAEMEEVSGSENTDKTMLREDEGVMALTTRDVDEVGVAAEKDVIGLPRQVNNHFCSSMPSFFRVIRRSTCVFHTTFDVVAGTNLGISFAVTPILDGTGTSYSGIVRETPLSYLSRLFTTWSGSLHYKFLVSPAATVVQTPFHSNVSLQYQPDVINPAGVVTITTSTMTDNSFYASIFKNQLDGAGIEAVVPWGSQYTVLYTNRLVQRTGVTPNTGVSDNGRIILFIENGSGSSVTYDVKVFVGAGEDFRLQNMGPTPQLSTGISF